MSQFESNKCLAIIVAGLYGCMLARGSWILGVTQVQLGTMNINVRPLLHYTWCQRFFSPHSSPCRDHSWNATHFPEGGSLKYGEL